jgi:hypothetical protein
MHLPDMTPYFQFPRSPEGNAALSCAKRASSPSVGQCPGFLCNGAEICLRRHLDESRGIY